MGLYRAIAVFCVLLSAGGTVRGGVIISEIMFNPGGTDNDLTNGQYTFTREWVELYNTDSTPIDISGWQFGDALDNEWASPFPAGTILQGRSALAVTGDLASFNANWGGTGARVGVSGFPDLANSVGDFEGAAIRNHLGAIQDGVRFQEFGWPTANGSHGNSIYLKPGAMSASANDVGSNWLPATQGVYGGRYVSGGGQGENLGSPGIVATQPQAAFAPSPDAAWSMVVIPDTQNYVKNTRDLPLLHQQIDWILANRDEYKIQLVMQEGDIVNQNSQFQPTSGNQTADQQWANARAAFSKLNGTLPYIMAVGNHDIGTTNAQSRDTQFNTFFKPSQNPLVDPTQGGILKGMREAGKLENAYFELKSPDGRDLLIFSLEFWPREATISWAKQISSLPQYRDHTAVLLTHSYMHHNEQYWTTGSTVSGLGTDGNDGQEMWEKLVRHNGNFEMTFNGHIGGDGVGFKQSVGIEGNNVYQMLLNTQFETNGGNGWFRVLEFLNDGETVRVRTYSPFLDQYREGAAHTFELKLSQISMTPGDFDANGVVDSSDLATWKANFPMASGARRIDGDANGDGAVDGNDVLVWQRQFSAAGMAPNSIPEPAGGTLALAAGAAWAFVRRRTSAPSYLLTAPCGQPPRASCPSPFCVGR